MAEGMAFDQMKPPIHVTDPQGLGQTEWPRHVHKAGVTDDGGPVYRIVQNPADEAAAVAEGWYLVRADALKAGASEAPASPPPARKR